MKNDRILSGELAIVNQLLPHRHPWAWDCYLKGMANHWVPSEVSMLKDAEQWRSRHVLSDDERLLVRRCLGFFAGSESLVANNLLLSIFRYCSDAEIRQYILRQAFEEAVHNHTVVHCCESLGLEIADVYEAYRNVPSIKAKDDFLMGATTDLGRPGFVLGSVQSKQEVLRNIVTFYIVCEGILFYAGFAMLLSFGRQNKLPGLSEQIAYTIRDESVHLEFGTNLVNAIVHQEPEVWTEEFQKETIRNIERAVELEVAYAHDVLPRGVLGLKAESFLAYMKFLANIRLEGIGLPSLYKGAHNPFPWLAENLELRKQKNFFETRVQEYQVGSLADDLD